MAIHPTTKRHFFHVPAVLHPLTEKYFGIFWGGALISSLGFWIQNVAQGWQVLQLTNSPLLLGLVSFSGTIPSLLLLPFGGVIADRFDRRRLVITIETIYLFIAALQGLLTTLHIITVWHIILMAFIIGIFNTVSFPSWQSLVPERPELCGCDHSIGPDASTNETETPAQTRARKRLAQPRHRSQLCQTATDNPNFTCARNGVLCLCLTIYDLIASFCKERLSHWSNRLRRHERIRRDRGAGR